MSPLSLSIGMIITILIIFVIIFFIPTPKNRVELWIDGENVYADEEKKILLGNINDSVFKLKSQIK